MKSVLFRTDASESTGAGHLMRCIALAQHLQSQGVKITFLTRTPWELLKNYLATQNFQVQELACTDAELGGDKDLKITVEAAKQHEWVVLDNYYFSSLYQLAVQKSGARTLVLDDVGTPKIHADIILNHGLGALALAYPETAESKMLLGPQYALIRSELIASAPNADTKGTKNILLTLGGGNHNEILTKWADAFRLLNGFRLKIKILINFSGDKGNLEKTFATVNCEFVTPTLDAVQLYEWADLAICAGGGTLNELCYYGIPGIVGILSENQAPNAAIASQNGLFDSVGEYAGKSAGNLAEALRKLISNPERIARMRHQAKKFVDGRGASRVYQAMEEITCEIH